MTIAEMERAREEFFTPVYDDPTIERLRKEFSRLGDEHYLDHAGATLYSETQIKNVGNDLLTSLYANPHSAGSAGNLTHEIVERTRHRILDHFHASSDEYNLVFTSGATAALKIIAETFRFSDEEASGRESGSFVYLQDIHTSVLGMRDLVSQRGGKICCLSREKAYEIFDKRCQIADYETDVGKNSLFVYSAQCNFNGSKYPLDWIGKVHNGTLNSVIGGKSGKWYVLLDAAGFVGTNDLDLSIFKPDFVALSFYKMFGYPTGTGALLVKKSSAPVLEKIFYGGGTVKLALSLENFHVKRDTFHERFEDGTVSFLSIISLQHGLEAISRVPLEKVSRHVFSLAKYLHHALSRLRHGNGNSVVEIYQDTNYEDSATQGGIVTFNLLRSNGEYVGYTEISHMAAINKIHLRTGCFCNPGACQRHLRLSNDDVMKNFEAGYVCGGPRDLINERPTGAVRISFGYMSTPENVEAVLSMIRQCFMYREIPRLVPFSFEESPSSSEITKNRIFNGNASNNSNFYNLKQFDENNYYCDLDNNTKFSTNKDEILRLSRLFTYPIKSCAAYEITDSWLLGDRGLEYDREWMIVTSAGVCLTQKQHVKLCLLKPQIDKENNVLILHYPGMPSAEVPLKMNSQNIIENELCRSRVCGHRVEGIDCGEEISEWLSLALKRPKLRLVRQNKQNSISKDPSKPELSFSSQAQYLLISEASVQWIIDRLPEDSDCSSKTLLHRFRANMVAEGTSSFRETTWTRLQIGNHKFKVDGLCTRCQMVCIDQTTGNKTAEPLRLIAEEFHGKMRFGIYLSKQQGASARISIGDPIIPT